MHIPMLIVVIIFIFNALLMIYQQGKSHFLFKRMCIIHFCLCHSTVSLIVAYELAREPNAKLHIQNR